MTLKQKNERELRSVLDDWDGCVKEALLKVENNRRRIERRPVLDPVHTHVHVPHGPHASLLMLNWKVWTLRYCVPLEFIIETLLRAYRKMRRYNPRAYDVNLGLPASIVAGVRARQIIEEEVIRTYPNGENYKMASMPLLEPPIARLNYRTPDEMVRAYTAAMTRRRKRTDRALRPKYRRNFRTLW